jgi:hypothetical protein
MLGAIAVILPFLAMVQVLANARDYRWPLLAIAVWVAVLLTARWLVPRLRAGGLSRAETVAAIGVAVGAVAVVGAVHRVHAGGSGSVDLSVLGTVWLLALVVLSRSAWTWVPASLLVFAVHSALVLRDGAPTSLSLSQLEAAGYVIAAILIAFAVLRPTMDVLVSLAGRQASLASRLAAERAAAAAIAQERQDRLAVLEREALPLLRAIAGGALDPAEPGVRERCARHAAVLRQSLTAGGSDAGELVTGLGPALRAAAARDLLVTVQQIGDPGAVRTPVARAVLAAVDTVLTALPPHQAVLTVLASEADVELYLTFGLPLRASPDVARFGRDVPAALRWRAEVAATKADGGCLEITWRKDVHA